MAKDKKRKPAAATPPVRAAYKGAGVSPVGEATAPAELSGLFSIKQYVLMNLIFDAFCILQLIIVKLVIRETRGLYFFFALLMLGFLAVSIFDYLYDRYIDKPEPVAE